MPRLRIRGFTLIELMIVLVVVGVLAAIALPSYLSYVKRANRSQAQQFLQDVANREEQYRLDARDYTANMSGANSLNLTIPADLATKYTPAVTTAVKLAGTTDCSTSALTAPEKGYVVIATPVAGGPQVSDGSVCIDSFGVKSPATKW